MKVTDQFAASFREEAAELLVEMESSLLELETDPQNDDLIARVFRSMHTIKGSGAMFGFDDVAAFTHVLETVFDRVRSGELAVTQQLVGLSLQGKDLIRAMLEGTGPAGDSTQERLVAALLGLLQGGQAPAAPNQPGSSGPDAPRSDAPAPARTYRVRFQPHRDLFLDGTNPLRLLEELRSLGACEAVAATSAIPPLEELEPELCYLGWDIVLSTERGENAIRDVFIFVEDRCELRIEVVDDGEPGELEPGYKKIGEILVERGDVSAAQLQEVLASQKRIGSLLQEQGLVRPEAVEAAALEQQIVREARVRRDPASQADSSSSIRVPAKKLDSLVDLVGELVIAQARLTQIASEQDNPALVAIAEEIDRLSAELRDNTLNIRMVQIGTTFSRFKRLVRDLSTQLGKEIELTTEGAETELDKTVIERLGDPLVHIIRNSCDHGIGTPAVRRAAGKPALGTVKLSAYQSGPDVIIDIQDDGAGLDPCAIRAKAEERGLIEVDAKLSDRELFQLIFLPGFSTAQQVSSLSGRGVGMDVVKRSVDALRGTVELTSERGVGTTTRIRLPLTLVIIEGLLVAVGAARYVLPMSLVEECIELTRREVESARGNQLAKVRGELVPYLRLRDLFAVTGERPEIEQVTVTRAEGVRFGFVVDEVIGQHQTVIKTLGSMYRDIGGLAGATILGDGTVALILDVPTLVRMARANLAHARG